MFAVKFGNFKIAAIFFYLYVSLALQGEYNSPSQLSLHLVTFSGQATPRWASLPDWELIKERNKPKEPPKKPKQAPFFLPTTSGLDTKFQCLAEHEKVEKTNETSEKILGFYQLENCSDFASHLSKAKNDEDFLKAFALLNVNYPSAIDVELRNMSPFYGGSYNLISKFLRMILS